MFLKKKDLKKKTTQATQELSKFINIIFKTNINPTEYDPGAFKSMDAWIPALSTAFQHSIQNIFFLPFLYSSEWKYMASVHCHIHYYSSTFFSLVQVYASELVDSISVFFRQQAKELLLLLNYREEGDGG